jgi:hypothetical protein
MGIRTLLGIGLEVHSCYILTKNLFTFSSCHETLWEAKFKENRLISAVEEI